MDKINTVIPKTIHYFWFGKNEKPPIFYKCLESWKKKCPDYKIIEWNEENFNININAYVSQAYKEKRYAFVSDYARFYILYKYGGIYLDIDVEILKNIDELLSEKVFMGFEDRNQVAPGLITGAQKSEQVIKDVLDIYNNFDEFPNDNHNVCKIVTNYLKENKGLKTDLNEIQRLNGITIYPFEYFCACDIFTKKKCITSKTYTIHHYNGSWLSLKDKTLNQIRKIVYLTIGRENYDKLKQRLKGK